MSPATGPGYSALVRKALHTMLTIVALCSSIRTPAEARLGGAAERGDNCTPFNAYAIGYPIPAATGPVVPIINESVVLDGGWRVVGWILTGRGGAMRLVAYRPTREVIDGDTSGLGVPPSYVLRSATPSDIRSAYEALRTAAAADGRSASGFIDSLRRFLVSPCFATGLRAGA